MNNDFSIFQIHFFDTLSDRRKQNIIRSLFTSLSQTPGYLTLKCDSVSASEKKVPAFICRRLQHHKFECSTRMLGQEPCLMSTRLRIGFGPRRSTPSATPSTGYIYTESSRLLDVDSSFFFSVALNATGCASDVEGPSSSLIFFEPLCGGTARTIPT